MDWELGNYMQNGRGRSKTQGSEDLGGSGRGYDSRRRYYSY